MTLISQRVEGLFGPVGMNGVNFLGLGCVLNAYDDFANHDWPKVNKVN